MKPAIDHLRHSGDHAAATTSELALTRDDEWMGRKERKRELKRELDQVRVIDGWEQYRMLWDGIEFKRQLINMGDKKVRRRRKPAPRTRRSGIHVSSAARRRMTSRLACSFADRSSA